MIRVSARRFRCAWLLMCLFSTGVTAEGDAARGQQRYDALCSACHSVDSNRIGPAHRGVYGRRAGNAPGFSYSPALTSATVVWTEDTLDRWLTNPERFLPGQGMGFAVGDATDRADIIAYLKTLKAESR